MSGPNCGCRSTRFLLGERQSTSAYRLISCTTRNMKSLPGVVGSALCDGAGWGPLSCVYRVFTDNSVKFSSQDGRSCELGVSVRAGWRRMQAGGVGVGAAHVLLSLGSHLSQDTSCCPQQTPASLGGQLVT